VRRALLISGLHKPDVLYVRAVADVAEKSVAPSAPNPDRAGPGIASIGQLGMAADSGAVEEGKA
jgi:hypothetical protein